MRSSSAHPFITEVGAFKEEVESLKKAIDKQTCVVAELEATRDVEMRAREEESVKLKKTEDDLVAARDEA